MKARYNKNKNVYTSIFPYADQYSVMGLSENDVHISHEHNVAGKDNKFAKPNFGEDVLIVAKKRDGAFVFVGRIGEFVEDDRATVWKRNGGNMWKFNYEITAKTDVRWLSNDDIRQISGCAENEVRMIWVDAMRGPKWGPFRDSIKNFLQKK